MKIAIHANEFDDRGISNVAYNYGVALKARGYEVCFITGAASPNEGAPRLLPVGPVIAYKGRAGESDASEIKTQIERIVTEEKIDFLHMLKFGTNDGITPTNCKTGIHCIFDMTQPHGDYYVAVSEYLAHKFGRKAFVPHIIKPMPPTEDWRKKYNIPEHATVFGRHGGWSQFNLGFVDSAVDGILAARKDVYFLFLNTEKRTSHERAIYIPWVESQQDVWNFIHACDAMLHARVMGETFGLACAEFSAANKPVLTWDGTGATGVYDTAHIHQLDYAAICYSNFSSLWSLLSLLTRDTLRLAPPNSGSIYRNWYRVSCRFLEAGVMVAYESEFHLKDKPRVEQPIITLEKPMDFESVFNRHGTDKGSYWHNYGKAYEYLLGRFSGKFNLLEIGVYEGKSILSWMDLFPDATIVGIDNNTNFKSPCEWVKIIKGDQANKDFLAQVATEHGPFSVIIDDGSHLPRDQQESMNALWPHVTPGGVYIVEDLEVSYVDEYQSRGFMPTLDLLTSKARFNALKTGGKEPWILFLGELAAIIKR